MRHTLKVQVVVAKKSKRIVCTAHDTGKTYDFKMLKKSKLPLRKGIMKKLHLGCELPKQASTNH